MRNLVMIAPSRGAERKSTAGQTSWTTLACQNTADFYLHQGRSNTRADPEFSGFNRRRM
jgi:hypothetical protein